MNILNFLKGAVATVGGLITFWLGGIDKLLIALVVVIVLDYLTGFLKAVYNKNLSSAIGTKGIARKVYILTIVALAYVIEYITNKAFPIREIVIMFFIANEGISILENAAGTGLPIPPQITDLLIQLREGKKKLTEVEESEEKQDEQE